MSGELKQAFLMESVRVIESLPDGEPMTGTDLYQDVIEPACKFDRAIWSCGFQDPKDPFNLLAGLHQIVAESVERRFQGLMLDVEAHGSPDGMMLAGGVGVSWAALRAPLQALNLATKNNLFVFMATCHGVHVGKAVQLTERAPFCGWIGPSGPISAAALRAATHEFFRTVMSTKNVTEALRGLEAAVALETGEKDVISSVLLMADQVFDELAPHALAELPAGDARKILRRDLLGDLADADSDPEVLARRESQVDRTLDDLELLRAVLRDRFLLVDLFPDLASRYGRSAGSDVWARPTDD